ncbi:ABC transporter ATP-binding protein [Terribacillus saccharophilus]|uniref:Dipeptide/oligopeptide/nickel ABC transporter ATP-binding protein n=1 Tax=Terribacillus saccharophilus TaxID=361277 RepID=A0A268A7C8_9BACI|nr:ABC transporter ATP-binding protein [Terribacillus saccharophilus]PAD20024.1 dipeptide/oligopeptide/nickel ABC transporter ATP-binding protein [Terribacillus saccharophilus]PAF20573.1 dipeptide/oligopeptide/nickel ABC transporter ATP-binding protein [Terribacillus saccharophilus]
MILSIEDLTVSHGENTIVDNVSLTIGKGEWVALVGQSGSGKTMLSQAVGQMLGPNLKASGSVVYQDQNLLQLSNQEIKQLRGKAISYIFQDYHGSFTPFMTISQHMDEYLQTHGVKGKAQRETMMREALLSVGLDDSFTKRYPFQLSGGQLQRASIAIALLLEPDVLIADEATTALDSVSAHRILTLLQELQQKTGCAILFITHDWRHVVRYADKIAVMKDGEIIETGSKQQLVNQPKHAYTRQLIQAAPTLPVRIQEASKS